MRGSKKSVHNATKRPLPSEPVGESSSVARSSSAFASSLSGTNKRMKSDEANSLAASMPPNMLLSTLRDMVKDRSRREEVVDLLAGTLRLHVKAAKHRVSSPHAMALLLFAREQPALFCDATVMERLIHLLMMKDLPIPMQSRPRGLQTLAVALLMLAFKEKDDWPEELFKSYLDDSVGELMWVYRQDCYHLVANLESAFPPHFGDAHQVFASLKPSVALASIPVAPDLDLPPHILLSGPLDATWLRPRYDFARPRIRDMLVRMIRETQVRRLSEVAFRSFLRVVALATGFPEVRREVALRIDSWLTVSKLHSHTNALLSILAQNCGKFDDVNDTPLIEALVQRIRLRLLTNIHSAFSEAVQHFIHCSVGLPPPSAALAEIQGVASVNASLASSAPLHQGNLHRLLAHCVHVTASFATNGICPCTALADSGASGSGTTTAATVSNNNNNSPIIVPILVKHATSDSVKHLVNLLLDHLFLLSHGTSGTVLVETGEEAPENVVATTRLVYILSQCVCRLASMGLLVDMWRSGERGLLRDYSQDERFLALSTPQKRTFVFTVVHLLVALQLLNAAQSKLREITANRRGSQSPEVSGHFALLNKIRHLGFRWIRRVVVNLLPKSEMTFTLAMTRTLLCFSPTVSSLLPSEVLSDAEMRDFARDMVHFVPLSRKLVNALLQQGASFSAESPSFLSGTEAVALVSTLVERAARVPEHVAESPLKVASRAEDLIANFFNSAAIQGVMLSDESEAAHFADRDCFWKCCLNMSILAAHNPTTCGKELWNNYPVMKCIMEMIMTGNFVFPTDSVVSTFGSVEKAMEHDRVSSEQDLQVAVGLHLISQGSDVDSLPLIRNNPTGPCRRPPASVLLELDTLSRSFSLGQRLLACREPDYLLQLLVAPVSSTDTSADNNTTSSGGGRQLSSERPWITNLVNQACSTNTLSTLPLQCLAEYLATQVILDLNLPTNTEPRPPEADAQRSARKHAVTEILRQTLAKNEDDASKSVSAMLRHSLFTRLRSTSPVQRLVARKCLASILLNESASNELGSGHLSAIYHKLFSVGVLQNEPKSMEEGFESLLFCFLHETDLSKIVDTLQYLGMASQAATFPGHLWKTLMQAVTEFVLGHPIIFGHLFYSRRHPNNTEGIQDSISALCNICLGYIRYTLKTPLEQQPTSGDDSLIVTVRTSSGDVTMSRDTVRAHWLILAHSDSVVSTEHNVAWMALYELWCKSGVPQLHHRNSMEPVHIVDEHLARLLLSCSHEELCRLAMLERDRQSILKVLKSAYLRKVPRPIVELIFSVLNMDDELEAWSSEDIALVSSQLLMDLELMDKEQLNGKHAAKLYNLRQRRFQAPSAAVPMEISSPSLVSLSQKSKVSTKTSSPDSVLKKWIASPTEFFKFWQSLNAEADDASWMLGVVVRMTSTQHAPQLLRLMVQLLTVPKLLGKFRTLLSQPECDSVIFMLFSSLITCLPESDHPMLASVACMLKENLELPLHWQMFFSQVAKLEKSTYTDGSGLSQEFQTLRGPPQPPPCPDPVELLTEVNPMIQALQISTATNVGSLVDNLSLFGLADTCRDSPQTKGLSVDAAIPQSTAWDGVHSLLFSSRSRHQHSEYFMAHLLHHSNTDSLRRCFQSLLQKRPQHQHYNASRVLDFLTACLRHPRLFFPVRRSGLVKRDELSDMHRWTLTEAKNLMDYVCMEMESLSERHGPESEICDKALRQRTSLLEAVVSGHEREIMRHCEQHRSPLAYRVVLCMYAHTPSLIGLLQKPVHSLTPRIALYLRRYETTALDRVTQYLFSALRGREGSGGGGGGVDTRVSVACRVLAATHPLLFLRYLPLLSALAESRRGAGAAGLAVMSSWTEVRARGYQSLVAHLVQILRLLAPGVFQPQWVHVYQESLYSLMIGLIRFVVRFLHHERRILLSLVGRLCLLLEQFRHENPADYEHFTGLYSQEVSSLQAQCPEEYLAHCQTVLSASSLMQHIGLTAVTSASEDALLCTRAPFNLHAHLVALIRAQDVRELLSGLKEVDSISKVSVEAVPFFMYELEQLSLHDVPEVRSTALSILRRHLQHRPSTSGYFPTARIEEQNNVMAQALLDPNSTAGDSFMKMMPELALLLPTWAPSLLTMTGLREGGHACFKTIDEVVASMNLTFVEGAMNQRAASV